MANAAVRKLIQNRDVVLRRMAQDHKKKMRRFSEDSKERQRKLSRARDAEGLRDEKKKFTKETRRKNEDFRTKYNRAKQDWDRRIRREKQKKSLVLVRPTKAMGDCYEANGRYFLSEGQNAFLCHGTAVGQEGTPIAGRRFEHCWVERGDTVFDFSNNRRIVLPRAVYYALGQISNVRRYNYDEFLEMLARYEHWGPWE